MLGHFQQTFATVKENGALFVLEGASVEVRRELDGVLVSLFSDLEGTDPKSNPFNATAEGFASFYVADGRYRITATAGSESVTLRNFVVGGGGDGPVVTTSELRVAVIGDSLTTENMLFNKSWPSKFEQYLNGSGVPARVDNVSVNGLSFFRALNEQLSGDQTPLERLVETRPDLVYVALGFNDAANRSQDRTSEQIISDAEETFDYLRDNLPDATLVWVDVVSHDQFNADVANLTNRGVVPYYFNMRSSGTLQGMLSPTVLGDSISAFRQVGYDRYVDISDLSSGIPSLANVDTTIKLDYYRIARLGCTGWDLLHPTDLGSLLMAGYVATNSLSNSVLQPLLEGFTSKEYPQWNSPDALFDDTLVWNGTDYDIASSGLGNFEQIRRLTNIMSRAAPEVWFYSTKAQVLLNKTFSDNGVFAFAVNHANPFEDVRPSDEQNVTNNVIATTNAEGNAVTAQIGPVPEGSYTIYYTIGNEHYGPYELEVTEANVYRDQQVELGLVNGWAPSTAYSDGAVRARKSLTGQVVLEGALIAGNATDDLMFTLPEGFRPRWDVGGLVIIGGQGSAVVLIQANGEVNAPGAWNTGSLIFLDPIQFHASS